MRHSIEAAIFDIDGMLLDTREWIYQAYEHTFSSFSLPVPERVLIAEHMGKTLKNCYELLAPDFDNNVLRSTHREFQNSNFDLISPYDGLSEMLDTLSRHVKLGAVSSRYGSVNQTLEDAGILNYFQVVVQGDDVKHHKPHPEGILKILSELDIAPEYASMAGDTVEDIKAGQSANVALTIAITHGFGTKEQLKETGPNFIVDSLEEIPKLLI